MPPLSQPALHLYASIGGTALPSRRMAGNGPVSRLSGDLTALGYVVMVLAGDDTVARTERVSARDDEEALLRAVRLADGRAADVWDGLRFVEHVKSTCTPSTAPTCADAA